MEPVVYDFAINDAGTAAALWQGKDALMPPGYYAICANQWLRQDVQQLSPAVRNEIAQFAAACRTHPRLAGSTDLVLGALFPPPTEEQVDQPSLQQILAENGFDPELHEQIRADLRAGRIGLAQNRLPRQHRASRTWTRTTSSTGRPAGPPRRTAGAAATESLAAGEVAVPGLGRRRREPLDARGGRGQGPAPLLPVSGQVPQLHRGPPGQGRRVAASLRHRTALRHFHQLPDARAHRAVLAGTRRRCGCRSACSSRPAARVGLRMVPMPRDLRFAWEEMPQQILDVQAQKVRESLHASLIGWAESAGGGSDYTDNLPLQCLHPTGHWFEVPNLLRNGTLARLLADRPQLKYLMLHNVDTLGADVDPGLLGLHIRRGACLTFEVIPRRIEDRGGGLARVGGRVRLVEGLAMPREEDEFRLSYYNSMTTWITIDRLLEAFGLARSDLTDEAQGDGRDSPVQPPAAHLHHAQRRQETLGARPGGHLPRGPVREAVGRHDRAWPRFPASSWPCRGCGASNSRSRPNSTSGSATAPPPTSIRCVPGNEQPPSCDIWAQAYRIQFSRGYVGPCRGTMGREQYELFRLSRPLGCGRKLR